MIELIPLLFLVIMLQSLCVDCHSKPFPSVDLQTLPNNIYVVLAPSPL